MSIFPSAGEPGFYETPGVFAAQAVRLVEAGARLIGGCCGTTPAHIHEVGALIPERTR